MITSKFKIHRLVLRFIRKISWEINDRLMLQKGRVLCKSPTISSFLLIPYFGLKTNLIWKQRFSKDLFFVGDLNDAIAT